MQADCYQRLGQPLRAAERLSASDDAVTWRGSWVEGVVVVVYVLSEQMDCALDQCSSRSRVKSMSAVAADVLVLSRYHPPPRTRIY